jgi:hypothetical protein
MQPIFCEEIKQCNQLMGNPEIGYYALFRPDPNCSPNWQKCRETFAGEFDSATAGFYFSHDDGQSENIARFINKVEIVADIDEKSLFYLTDKSFAMWIEPSMFWRECVLKRSLLTAFLRCGMKYKWEQDNFDDALWSQSYTKITEHAVKRFLFGFTKIASWEGYTTGNKNGWQTIFENKTVEQVRKQLVRPREIPDAVCFGSFLWT